jgi:3-hydroxybutyryl-CoA dehydrogenase
MNCRQVSSRAEPFLRQGCSLNMAIVQIAVVGAGTMGSGIAQTFALHGFPVSLIDLKTDLLERALHSIKWSLDRLATNSSIPPFQQTEVISRITTGSDLDGGAGGADFVIEAVTEDTGIKKALFQRLDRACRADVILASNTSAISISALGGATNRADRVIGMHFMNPVPLIPLVEIVHGQSSSEQSLSTARDLCVRINKTAVDVKDAPGFVANRVLMPMINEAMTAAMEGVATPEDIDTVMKLGMRHPIGPLALADLIGLDVCLAILKVLYEGLGDPKFKPCPLLERMVAEGVLGKKTGRGFHTY